MKKSPAALISILFAASLVHTASADSITGKVAAVRYCAETIPGGYCDKGIVKVTVSNPTTSKTIWFDIANVGIDYKLLVSILLTSKSTGTDATLNFDPSQAWFQANGRLQSTDF
jgi:hypothetical protein